MDGGAGACEVCGEFVSSASNRFSGFGSGRNASGGSSTRSVCVTLMSLRKVSESMIHVALEMSAAGASIVASQFGVQRLATLLRQLSLVIDAPWLRPMRRAFTEFARR